MAKKNFSARVEEALKGRETEEREISQKTDENAVTEEVNSNVTNVSNTLEEKSQITEESDKNGLIDNSVINLKNEEIKETEDNIKDPEELIIKDDDEALTNPYIRYRKTRTKKTFLVSTWIPIELEEGFEAASIMHKNGSRYLCKLVEEDLKANGEKYKETARIIASFMNK